MRTILLLILFHRVPMWIKCVNPHYIFKMVSDSWKNSIDDIQIDTHSDKVILMGRIDWDKEISLVLRHFCIVTLRKTWLRKESQSAWSQGLSQHTTLWRGVCSAWGVAAEVVTCGPAPAQKRPCSELCARSWDGTGAQYTLGSAGLSARPSLLLTLPSGQA